MANSFTTEDQHHEETDAIHATQCTPRYADQPEDTTDHRLCIEHGKPLDAAEAGEHGNLVSREIFLEPCLIDLHAIRRGDVTHTLGIADKIAGQPILKPESIEVSDRIGPAKQCSRIDIERDIQLLV